MMSCVPEARQAPGVPTSLHGSFTPAFYGEAPICILQSRILRQEVNAKMKSTTSFVGNLWEVLDRGDTAKAK